MNTALLATCVCALMVACGAPGPSDDAEVGEQELATYRTTVATRPSPVVVGARASIDVRVNGPAGAAVTRFDPLHTQPMHLIAVSADLEDFIHVHPALQPAGSLTGDATFSRAQPYSLFIEYDPAGAPGPTVSRATITPAGAVAATPRLNAASAFGGSVSKTVTAGGTVVELVGAPGGMIMPNVPARFVVRFRNTNGTAVDDLTNWLGMPAHAIVVSADVKTFVHAHGMPESAGGGHGGHEGASTKTGPVAIDVTLPKAGLYKMFVQFQRGDTVITAPFVLSVMAGQGKPPQPSCATTTCPAGQHCMAMGSPPAPMCM